MSTTIVKCPKCGTEIDTNKALESVLRNQLQLEYQTKFEHDVTLIQNQKEELEREKKQVLDWKQREAEIIKNKLDQEREVLRKEIKEGTEAEYETKIKSLLAENDVKNEQLKQIQLRDTENMKQIRMLKDQEDKLKFDMERKMAEREEEIKKQIEKHEQEKSALIIRQKESELKRKEEELTLTISQKVLEATERTRIEESLKQAELIKQMNDQKKLIAEMQKKSEQGSMQLQGEVQETELEKLLLAAFPFDSIEEVAKGIRGADCVQTVRSDGRICGTIIFESKRTKVFSNEWITKLREDQRNTKCDLAVLVTEALPKELRQFGQMDDVWVCTFTEVKALVSILRYTLINISNAIASQENKGDKMQMLYDYLTGNEFRQRISGIMEAFNNMQDDLMREKKLFAQHWSKREKEIERVLQNTLALYGSVKGIAGGAISEIKGLELPPVTTNEITD